MNYICQQCKCNAFQIELITKYKYPAEQHYVTTEDGYILSVVRIPYGRMCSKEKSKGPIILQHGLFTSSFNWILTGTRKGLGKIRIIRRKLKSYSE